MRLVIGCICCLLLTQVQGQLLDVAKAEYLYVPGSSSNFEYHRQEFEVNVPFEVKEGGYLFVGFDYSRIVFRFQETEDSYDKTHAENFQSIDLNLTYTFEMKNNWRFGLQLSPSINSNFQDGITSDDFLMNGVAAFIKTKDGSESKKRNRLIIGLAYSTISRVPIPFPFINYYRKFHPKWSYTIGAPYSNIQYHASEKNRFKIHAEGDAFNAHIQEDILVENFGIADRIRVFIINVGFRYEYKFSEHIESYLVLSRTVFSDLQLRKGKDMIFQPGLDNAMFFRLGVRCKI
ncbi:DUF6268 family outer membrane beta-barrel protein [Ekhidna sp. To15]|uniref:DUF6268 family outer membrane beta-barrel protein n=1 Tax=Ekhidna sp. To15 TaxID=3395267 RepID=UPI003F51C534